MLPSAKTSLEKGGYSSKASAWILIALLLAGSLGIMLFSNIIHRFIPTDAIGCDHTHTTAEGGDEEQKAGDDHDHSANGHTHAHSHEHRDRKRQSQNGSAGISETTPLLKNTISSPEMDEVRPAVAAGQRTLMPLSSRMTRTVSNIVTGANKACEHVTTDSGKSKCFGFSDPCGADCFRKVNARGGARLPMLSVPTSQAQISASRMPQRSTTTSKAI